MTNKPKSEPSKFPWWGVVVFFITVIIISLSFSFAQDIVDARATRCEAMMDRLADPAITVGEVERLRIENAECYPSEWAWPSLLQPQSKEKRSR